MQFILPHFSSKSMILSIFCHIFGKFSPFLSKLWDFRHISGDRRSWNNIYFAPNLSISGYFWGYLLDFGLFLLKIMDFEHIFVDTHPWNEVYFLGFEAYFVRIKPIFGDLSSFLRIFCGFRGLFVDTTSLICPFRAYFVNAQLVIIFSRYLSKSIIRRALP